MYFTACTACQDVQGELLFGCLTDVFYCVYSVSSSTRRILVWLLDPWSFDG